MFPSKCRAVRNVMRQKRCTSYCRSSIGFLTPGRFRLARRFCFVNAQQIRNGFTREQFIDQIVKMRFRPVAAKIEFPKLCKFIGHKLANFFVAIGIMFDFPANFWKFVKHVRVANAECFADFGKGDDFAVSHHLD